MDELIWSMETPNETGLYLFYGYRFKRGHEQGAKKEYLIVKARLTGNDKLILIANDGFMWDSERGEGVFTRFPDMLSLQATVAFYDAFPQFLEPDSIKEN